MLSGLWSINTRILATPQVNARHRITLDYNITPKLSAGLEYNPTTGELQPRGTWFVTPATKDLPSVVLGASADRLSTERGHAVFLTLSKAAGSQLTVFAGGKFGTFDRRFYFPFGANVSFAKDWTLQYLYDGNFSHVLVSKSVDKWIASFVLARFHYPGIQLGVRF